MITAIIAAAGNGSRAAQQQSKVLFVMPDGKTVLEHAVKPFVADERITEIIVTAAETDEKVFGEILKDYPVKIIRGGKTRSETVKIATEKASGKYVIIHDGARPFLTQKSVYKCVNDLLGYKTAVLAIPCTDTIGELYDGEIVNASRQNKVCVQTPQAFEKDKLLAAFALNKNNEQFTDETGLYCRFIGKVHFTDGDRNNIKLTYPEDFEKLTPHRMGCGYDLHTLTENRKLIIGGVEIAHTKGLSGHSDADVLTHAVMDALLSAAGLRDIGYYFSDKDPQYENISSLILLQKVSDMISEKGYKTFNVAAVVMAEKPKLNPYVPQMKENLAKILKIKADDIGITCTTSEKVGFIGREEGIAVMATALLIRA